MLIIIKPYLIFDFDHNTNLNDWKIIDDVVMGGKSNGKFTIDNDGNGVFSGDVSVEINRGSSTLDYCYESRLETLLHHK